MDDIAGMVREDIKFKVIDAKSEEDLTRITLTQIILDQETKGYNLIPLELLLQIVKFCNHPMNKVYSEYLLTSIKAFESNMDNLKGVYGDVFDPKLNPAEQMAKMGEENMKIFNNFMQSFLKDNNESK